MRLLQILGALALALGLQEAVGLFHPEAHRWVDLMLVAVVAFGLAGSQRSGMLVGCASGLLQDAWFEIGIFGLNGFKRTLLGWMLGGLGSRFDFNHSVGRFAAGFLASIADSLMDLGLRRLLDQRGAFFGAGEALGRAVLTGLLVVIAFSIVERVGRYREMRRLA